MKYREGLILGSACEAGELFRAILDGQNEEQIACIVDFYPSCADITAPDHPHP